MAADAANPVSYSKAAWWDQQTGDVSRETTEVEAYGENSPPPRPRPSSDFNVEPKESSSDEGIATEESSSGDENNPSLRPTLSDVNLSMSSEGNRKEPSDDTDDPPVPPPRPLSDSNLDNVPNERSSDEGIATEGSSDENSPSPRPLTDANLDEPNERTKEKGPAMTEDSGDENSPPIPPRPLSYFNFDAPNERSRDERTATDESGDENNPPVPPRPLSDVIFDVPNELRPKQGPPTEEDPARSRAISQAVHKARGTLRQFGRVILSGPPDSGKTAVVKELADEFKTQGYSVSDWNRDERHALDTSSAKGKLILIDGAIGDPFVDVEAYQRFEELLDEIHAQGAERSRRFLVVLTVYPHQLKEIQYLEVGRRQKPLAGSDVVVFLGGQCFNPWLDSGRHARSHLRLVYRMAHNATTGNKLEALLVLGLLGFKDFVGDEKAALSRLEGLGVDQCCWPEVEQRAKYFRGNILSATGSGFSNDYWYDAAGLVLSRRTFLPTVLQICSSRFLLERVRVTGLTEETDENEETKDEDDWNHVTVAFDNKGRTCVDLVMRRMFDLMLEGNLYPLCLHPALASQRFLSRFSRVCRKVNKKKGVEQLMSARHRESNLPLLFHTLWGPYDTLTSWCLKHTIEQCSDKALATKAVFSALVGSLLFAETPTAGVERATRILAQVRALSFEPEFQDSELELTLPLPPRAQADGRNCYDDRAMAELFGDVPASLLSAQVTKGSAIVRISARNWYLALRLLTDQAADETDSDGNTVLHLAAQSGDEDAVNAAVDRNSSLLVTNHRGLTPYQLALRRPGKVRGVERRKLLQETKAACMCDDLITAKRLLVLHGFGLQETTEDGNSLLHTASWAGHVTVVAFLLDLGADVNARNAREETPLHLACLRGQVNVIAMLPGGGG